MKSKLSLILLALVMLISSCHKKEGYNQKSQINTEEEVIPIAMSSIPPPPPAMGETINLTSDDIDLDFGSQNKYKKKNIKESYIDIDVSNLESSKNQIDSFVKSMGGYYSNELYNKSTSESSHNLEIRIPCKNFDSFLSKLGSEGYEITYKRIISDDVSEEFYDLETRLSNKNSYLNRYKELLKKALSVKDILEIEEKIRLLTEEIESTKGRIKFINSQVSYSTIHLNLKKRENYLFKQTERDSFKESIKKSLDNGWNGIIDFILSFISFWPFWIILTIAIIVLKKFWKKRNK